MACLVRQRRREIGVAVALGARPGHILRQVLGQAMKLTLAGIAAGLTGAFFLTRFISSLLHGVTPVDPLTYGGVCVLIAVVAIAAAYFPARSAMRVDPLTALRDR
jgi:ABC-type antimicrobial peptide transport system permease subunit